MNRLISMLIHQALNWGTRKGVDHLARRWGRDGKPMPPDQARKARQTAHRARQGLGILRRFMR